MNKQPTEVDPALRTLRTRWKQWIRQKTKWGKPYWPMLLHPDWLGWAAHVLNEHGVDIDQPTVDSHPLEIKAYYLQAIEYAGSWDLMKLDGLHTAEFNKRRW